jgi:hypothetical protein
VESSISNHQCEGVLRIWKHWILTYPTNQPTLGF